MRTIIDSNRSDLDPTEAVCDIAMDPDLKLLRRYAELGDADAFAQIVQRYASVVYATSLRIIGNSARAEDVSQETFFRLMRRPGDITHHVGAWLHRTATHLSLDSIRSESCRKKRELVYSRDCDREASTWSELSPSVDQALTEMPEELRTLLVRHYLMGRTQADLAVEFNQSVATISRRMKLALEDLRKRLRLKGVFALPAALAGLLCHVAARQAPASLMRELGKMSMIQSAASELAPRGGRGQPDANCVSSSHASPTFLSSVGVRAMFLIYVIALTFIFLQFYFGARPAHSDGTPYRQVPMELNVRHPMTGAR